MYASSLTRWRTGGVEEGAIFFSTEILTNNKNDNKTSTKRETTAKEQTLHHIHTVHLPFFSILIPQVLLPLFFIFLSSLFFFFGVHLELKPSELWLLAFKCESLNLRTFTSLLGVNSVVEKQNKKEGRRGGG